MTFLEGMQVHESVLVRGLTLFSRPVAWCLGLTENVENSTAW